MADDIVLNPGVGGALLATDEIGGRHFELIKINLGADGVDGGMVTPVNPFPVQSYAAVGTQTNVAGAIADTLLLAANASRKGATIYNDAAGGNRLRILLSTVAASSTVFTVRLSGGDYFELPFGYTGMVRGIWDIAAGTARVTEFT